MPDVPTSAPILRFDPALPKKDPDKIRDNVSAIVLDGDHLWIRGLPFTTCPVYPDYRLGQ